MPMSLPLMLSISTRSPGFTFMGMSFPSFRERRPGPVAMTQASMDFSVYWPRRMMPAGVSLSSGSGRLSSTYEPVTHPNYRGRARLAYKTPEGIVFGTGGILAGQGEPLCRLERVNSEVPVSVGDDVYTDTSDGLFPEPMYYGKVVKVNLQPGSPRWEITVKPAASEFDPQTVQILRKLINPVRIAGPG